ncbi:MAG: ACP S-malonyltransferase [Gammaproteobacteria bacterium]|nr:ACP S-malonyltransferase [Gammaproteobacteria bacterium]
MKYAVVFPGQGSQSINMLSELASEYEQINQTYAEASEVLGYDLAGLIRENPEGKLNQTEYTQPAMLSVGVAVWRIWQSRNLPPPSLLAGHSLGEYTALVAANSISFQDAVGLVAARGRFMQSAVPPGQGAMAAILGLEDDQVILVCRDAAEDEVVEAVNFNSPNQIVIAGTVKAVQRAIDLAEAEGATRAIMLPVSVPSHSSLMLAADTQLAQQIASVTIRPPAIPVLHNIDAQARNEPDAIAEALRSQLHNPVRWVDIVQAMHTDGIESILEFGPGKVLAGLCKRTIKELNIAAVDSVSGLNKAKDLVLGESSA